MRPVRDIPIANIRVGKRLRPLDEARVALLADSMGRLKQIAPIEVHAVGGGRFELVVGWHRLEAAKRIGLKNIEAREVDGNVDVLEQREIEENFVRHDLNALDRAIAVRRWFHHQGAIQAPADGLPADPNLIKKQCFGTVQKRLTAQIAEKVGLSEASIYRDLKIADGIAEFQERLAGHAIANDRGQLKRLAALPTAERRQAVKGIVAGEPFNEVLAKLPSKKKGTPANAKDKHLSALIAAWNKATKSTKATFVKTRRKEIADLLDQHGAAT